MMAFGGAGIRPYDGVYMYPMILLIIITLVYIISLYFNMITRARGFLSRDGCLLYVFLFVSWMRETEGQRGRGAERQRGRARATGVDTTSSHHCVHLVGVDLTALLTTAASIHTY